MSSLLYHPTELEKSYLAGILDGEGHITIRIRHLLKRYYSPFIEVTNTRKLLLEWIQSRWGGSIVEDSYARKNRSNTATCWKWRIESNRVKDVLKQVMPYLVIKKEQAQLVISMPYRTRAGKGKPYRRIESDVLSTETLCSQVRFLNRVGGKHGLWNGFQESEASPGAGETDGGGIQEVRDGEGDGSVVA